MDLGGLFNVYNNVVGNLSSDVRFNLYRPDYTASSQIGTLIASNLLVRYDTRASTWAEPSLAEGMYYDIFPSNRKIIQEGDVLIPVGLSPTASSGSDYPVITVLSLSALKPLVGLLTDHRGSIQDGGVDVYTNVRWQWASMGTPKGGLNKTIYDTTPFDRRKVLMYKRQGVGAPTAITTQMQITEVIDGLTHIYEIIDIITVGNETYLQVEEDAR